MEKTVRVNENCLVRNQKCDRIFEGSKTCFIACPSSEEVALELEIIKQKLKEVNIAPYIAVEEREFQKDIFCEKICSKIIESQFCIAILNDVIDKADKTRKPNANVYYEYGLMTAFRKKIIPIQLEGQSLAFNIQSLDTVKYTQKRFIKQMEEAIKQILLVVVESEDKNPVNQDINLILANKGLFGIDKNNIEAYPNSIIDAFERCIKFSSPLGFSLYQRLEDNCILFVINKENLPIKEIILMSKLLTLNIKNYIETLSGEIENQAIKANFDLDTLKSSEHVKNDYANNLRIESIFDDYNNKLMLENSKIIVLVDDNEDSQLLKSEYSKMCEEIGFELNMEELLLD
jgi:hypothetical protein